MVILFSSVHLHLLMIFVVDNNVVPSEQPALVSSTPESPSLHIGSAEPVENDQQSCDNLEVDILTLGIGKRQNKFQFVLLFIYFVLQF
jgi:hypothetical protein